MKTLFRGARPAATTTYGVGPRKPVTIELVTPWGETLLIDVPPPKPNLPIVFCRNIQTFRIACSFRRRVNENHSDENRSLEPPSHFVCRGRLFGAIRFVFAAVREVKTTIRQFFLGKCHGDHKPRPCRDACCNRHNHIDTGQWHAAERDVL